MIKARINFEIRTNRSAKGKCPIVVRIYLDKKNKYITTPFKIFENEWLFEKERTKSDLVINNFLNDINIKFNQLIISKSNALNVDHIALQLFEKEEENKTYLLSFIRNHIVDKEKKNDVIQKTILRYKRIEKVMTDFLNSCNKKQILINEVNNEFINNFDTYIKQNLLVNNKPMGKNTINKYHSLFRTILIQGVNQEKINVNPYNNFKLKSKPTNRKYLTNEELNLFKKASFEIEKAEKVRLIYLFSCFTGIRFEDSQSLTISNMKTTSQGDIYLSFISSKSTKQQEIPLINEAIDVIEKIKEKFGTELLITGKILPRISNQKFNDYLKSISVRIGIDKELTHHTARHTFATFMLGKGVTPSALQVLLGHSNLKETMLYAKITPDYLLEEVKKGNARI